MDRAQYVTALGGQHMPCEAYGLVDIGTVAIDPQVSLPALPFVLDQKGLFEIFVTEIRSTVRLR